VDDVVDAYLTLGAAVDRPEVAGQAFNFSSGRPVQVVEIVRLVQRVMGRTDLEPVILDQVRAEIRDQFLDASKAARVLHWAPSFSLDEGLARTADWYRDFLAVPPTHDLH
jgi:CDP-glucose 4,6-dehydratase